MIPSRSFAAIACAVLLVIYATIAWTSVRGKSPTYDEPVHAVAAIAAIQLHDFRTGFDNPPLWDYWAALPSLHTSLRIDTTSRDWALLPDDDVRQYQFAAKTLYETPGNDPDTFITRGRFMMLLIAVALGVVIARWSWQLGGGVAAIAATFLFCFDPNLLAHGPLFKNDVVVGLLLTALSLNLWKLGKRVTIGRAMTVALLCGVGCSVKFSGVLMPFIAVLLLFARAIMNEPWPVVGRVLAKRAERLIASSTIIVLIAVVTFAVIWASYGFRFSVSPDPSVRINTDKLVAKVQQVRANSQEAIATDNVSLSVRAVIWALHHRLLPEPWLNGLLAIRAATLDRPSFLLGQYSNHAWWWYYPAAMFFKTPASTMIAMTAALIIVLVRWRSNSKHLSTNGWAISCLLAPPVIYFSVAVLMPTAVGLRHMLPVYPFLFIACGWVAGITWPNRLGKTFTFIIAVGLMCETLMVYPNFIPFFNLAVGGEPAGIDLLSDSNLDWDQDLPLLAQWQREHPDVKLYLCYVGTVDPTHYGIRYTNLPGGFDFGPPEELPSTPGVIAISATELQGVYALPQMDTRSYYAPYRNKKPMAVLGGSIYLFKYP
jgi:hypothetical protein